MMKAHVYLTQEDVYFSRSLVRMSVHSYTCLELQTGRKLHVIGPGCLNDLAML